jgi:hypothetical protein
MHVNVPEVDVQRASLSNIAIGQVAIGPITVGEMVINNVDFSMSAGVGFIRGMTVTVRLRIDFEWHIHIPLPWPFDDIDIGDTNYLGTFSFNLPPVGDVTIPGLSNLHFQIPSLTAHNVSATADPLSNVQLNNAAAEQVQARDVVLPTAGFTIAGLSLNSVEGDNISVPAAGVRQATVGRVRGDPLNLGDFSLQGVSLGQASIPSLFNTTPFDVPANLQARTIGPFDFGILGFSIIITPSATSHIPYFEVDNSNATATTGRVVLHNVTLPFDALNLTLSQIGINTIGIPAFTAA